MSYANIFSLSFDELICTVCSGEPDDYLSTFKGSIICLGDDEESEVMAGSFHITLIDIDAAWEDGYSLHDVFDATESVKRFSALLDLDNGNYVDGIDEAISSDGYIPDLNLLLIERISIIPRFRGIGLGADVINALVRKFRHGIGLVALRVFPLQYELNSDASMNTFTLDETDSTKKLIAYYNQLGFIVVPDYIDNGSLHKSNIMIKTPM